MSDFFFFILVLSITILFDFFFTFIIHASIETVKDGYGEGSVLTRYFLIVFESSGIFWFVLYACSDCFDISLPYVCALSLATLLLTKILTYILARLIYKVLDARDPFSDVDTQLNKLKSQKDRSWSTLFDISRQKEEIKKMLDANEKSVLKCEKSAEKALLDGEEDQARKFLDQKQQLEQTNIDLQNTYKSLSERHAKLRQMYDQLLTDIALLTAHRQLIEANLSANKAKADDLSFNDVRNSAKQILDEAQAMSELETKPVDEANTLAKKYKN